MKTIKLTFGRVAAVDDGDFEWLSRGPWYYSWTGYAMSNIAKYAEPPKMVYMHRLILNAGGPEEQVDHINHDKLDNRRWNLRICTSAQNQANRLPLSNKMYCDFKGVTRDRRRSRWCAQITSDKEVFNLGTFETAEDAARAYDRHALELHGEFAMTNEMLGLLPPDDRSGGSRVLLRSDNTSGYSGVRMHKASGLWQARVWENGETVWAKYFGTAEDGHIARVEEMRLRGISPNLPAEAI